ncbi:MAG: HAMP domain-containing protein [Chromatiaceae bacterium]|nr:HAMP domain-containing protein [Chromatiaceae bacterium]MCP5446015.1 HAMP domain-containing protein [Chromatiaceae bacterium]
MKLPDIFNTTALRLAVRYLLIYAVVLGIALGAFAWITGRYVSAGIEAGLAADLTSVIAAYGKTGVAGASAEIQRLTASEQSPGRFFLLTSKTGEKIAGTLLAWPKESEISLAGVIESAWLEDNVLPIEVDDDEVYWPVVARQLPGGERLLVTQSVEQVEELNELVELLVEVLGAAILLSIAMSISIGRAILRRIETVSDTAAEIMAGDLSTRIAISTRNDEFDTLAGRLNVMLDRIQTLIAGIRDVTDNVAHDLRSPLTRLRNHLEITLLESRSEQEYRDAIERAVEDTESLINTFNSLLRIAQVESGNHREQWQVFDLGALVVDLANIYRPLAEEKGLQLNDSGLEVYRVFGNSDLIAQTISNLLDNAVKYTPENGRIDLAMRHVGGCVEVRLSDTGPGIPEVDRKRVFERFTRLETSRSLPGNGLGLSLVQATCRLHGAEINLADAAPGLAVVIRFPLARPDTEPGHRPRSAFSR